MSSNKESTIYGPRLVSNIDESNGFRLVYLGITILYHVMSLYFQRCNTPQRWRQYKVKGKCKGIQTFLPCQVHFNGLFTCFESNFFEITYVSYPFVMFMFAEVQQSTPLASTQIHREMKHAQLLDKSLISGL